MASRVRHLNEMKPVKLGSFNGSNQYYWVGRKKDMTDGTLPGPPYKSGNGLVLLGTEYEVKPSQEVDLYGIGSPRRHYQGKFIPSAFNVQNAGTLPGHLSAGSQAAWLATHQGNMAKGWNKFKPGKPGANLGQALVELHQIPTIPRWVKGLRFYQNLGNNYLNYQFGWRPFLNDLMDGVKSAHTMAKRLAQLRRDNGKWVRRRGIISSDTVVTPISAYGTTSYPLLTSEFYLNPVNPATESQYWHETRKHWFSAAFRYWIPDINEPDWEYNAIVKQLGLYPTPGLVWEVLPWSWLVDWFTNIGDVLDNVSGNAAENLTAKYAYLMSSLTVEKRAEARVTVRTQLPEPQTMTLYSSAKIIWTYKLRTAANPFGFGVTYAGLSAKQTMILAALGLSRHG